MVAIMTPRPLCPWLPRPTEAMKHDRVDVYWMFIWNEPSLIRHKHQLVCDTGRRVRGGVVSGAPPVHLKT